MTKKRYKGCIVQKLIDKKTYQGLPKTFEELNQVTYDEANKMLPKMKGLKMCSNHDESKQIGHVTDASINENGGFEIEFELDLDENILHDLIDNNIFNGLSLSHAMNSCTPIEVSLCWEGARPGTHVYKQSQTEPNIKDYIEQRSNDEIIIRASLTEANKFFAMNNQQQQQQSTPVSNDQSNSNPQQTTIQPPLQSTNTSNQSQPQTTPQPPQQPPPQQQQQQSPEANEEARIPASIHKLFQLKSLEQSDKLDLCKHLTNITTQSREQLKQISELQKQIEERDKKIAEIKEANRHSAKSVLTSLESALGMSFDDAKMQQMEQALENSPEFMKSGLPDIIVQCSRERQHTQQSINSLNALDPGQKMALDYYNQFLALQDSKALPPMSGSTQMNDVVRASMHQYSGNKRNYATAMNSNSSYNTTVDPHGYMGKYGRDVPLEIAHLLETTKVTDDYTRQLDHASGDMSSKRQML